jgi:DNA-directed RNA polymerase beta' subunit
MPPKVINLGAKKGLPSLIPTNEVKVKLPTSLIPSLEGRSILEDTEIQQTIDSSEKSRRKAFATSEEDKLPRYIINGVEFSVLTSEILSKLQVVNVSTKINREQPFDMNQLNAQPRKDPRYSCSEANPREEILRPSQSVTSYIQMGVMDNNYPCITCGKTNIDCPGHLGEITFNQTFIHPLFRVHLLKTLSCVCYNCSNLLIKEEQINQLGINKLSGNMRLRAMYEICKDDKVVCRNKKCGRKRIYIDIGKASSTDPNTIRYKDKSSSSNSEAKVQDIEETIRILSTISQRDASLLGFQNGSHPKDMLMSSMAVIPPCARPFTIRDGMKKEDHLTTAYDEIIRDNYKLSIVTDPYRKINIEKDLYFHISHFIDNSDKKYCRSPNETIMGIKQRITRKEGLIRSNIMGKRVNFCGRSVIGPDSTLKFGEVGIPEKMCEILTVPEMVHPKNLEYIRQLWNDRQIVSFTYGDGPLKGNRYNVFEKTYSEILNGKPFVPYVGFTVHRKLRDGDIVLVNRQPTLYKYALIGDFVKKVPRKNIALHMCETKMRNADFDGDEANIHVMQELDARVEAMTFANVKDAIPSALKNNVMIGMFFNGLSSAYIMTREPTTNYEVISKFSEYPKHEVEMLKTEIILTRDQIEDAHSLLSYRDDLPTLNARLKKHGINPLCGKALFSCILPADFNYYKKDKTGREYTNEKGETITEMNEVIIKDGVLIKGRIGKDHIGQGGGTSIQMSIWKWYGRERAVSFITDCTYITDWFILEHGLTIGFDDIASNASIRKNIDNIKNSNVAKLKVEIMNLEPITDDMTVVAREAREKKTVLIMSDSKRGINSIANKSLSPENPLNIMADSGAKGKAENTANITGLKGQEFIFGRRPEMRISDETRCLPYFDYNSENIKARGFVAHSFLDGMTPSEMYFLSEGAREGSISIASNVGRSGDLYRKLTKTLEDYKTCYDGSVRNANDFIYQLGYYDGFDGGEVINVKTKTAGDVVSFINLEEAAIRINNIF